VVDFEEGEAQLRPAEKDASLFRKICQDIRQLFSDIAELKTKDTDEVMINNVAPKYFILLLKIIYLPMCLLLRPKKKSRLKE
jgi:hypothetical protein